MKNMCHIFKRMREYFPEVTPETPAEAVTVIDPCGMP